MSIFPVCISTNVLMVNMQFKVYLHQSLSLTESMVIQKYHYLSVLQLTPTVCSINEVDWWSIITYGLQDYWNIGMSLGISPKVLEKVQGSVVGDDMAKDHIVSMLMEWLNHKKGTGNKKRTWDTICTAVANGCSHFQALSILEQGM